MSDKTDKSDTTDQTTAGTPASSPTTTDKAVAAEDVEPERFGRRRLPTMKPNLKPLRTGLARAVWVVCVLAAAVLAAAVLLIAIDANPGNDLVRFIIDAADRVDLGFFDLTDPIKDFDTAVVDPGEDVKTALFNYGICAIVWLVVGRVADRIIRP